MKPDPDNNKTLIAEMELNQRKERERYELLKSESELAKLVACQEVEKYKREYLRLREKMGRLEEDCSILRERELKDQEKIKGLLVEIERKEKAFVELKVEIRDLECDKRRAMDEVSEWKKRYEEEMMKMEVEIKELFVENRELACAMNKYEKLRVRELKHRGKEKEGFERMLLKRVEGCSSVKPVIIIDDELPKRSAECLQLSHREDFPLTPEQRSKRVVVFDSDNEGGNGGIDIDDEDDWTTLSQMKRRKLTESTDAPPKKQKVRVRKARKVTRTCNKVCKETDSQFLFLPRNKAQEVSGVSGNSKSLLEVANGECRLSKKDRSPRSKKKCKPCSSGFSLTARRKSVNHPVSSDLNGVADTGFQSYCKSGEQYIGSIPSSEQQLRAVERAKVLQSNMISCHPSFIKSMLRSHVSECAWLGLPGQFCKENLSTDKLKMILEDEKGLEFNVIYIGYKTGLSGGWRGFVSAHHVEIGDALIFELCEPTRFKVYIIKANLEFE